MYCVWAWLWVWIDEIQMTQKIPIVSSNHTDTKSNSDELFDLIWLHAWNHNYVIWIVNAMEYIRYRRNLRKPVFRLDFFGFLFKRNNYYISFCLAWCFSWQSACYSPMRICNILISYFIVGFPIKMKRERETYRWHIPITELPLLMTFAKFFCKNKRFLLSRL